MDGPLSELFFYKITKTNYIKMSPSPKKTKEKPNGKPKNQTKWSVTQKLEVID